MFEIPKYILEVLDIFYDNGYEAYIVGGAVRDILLGLTPMDYDLTTNARPREMDKLFKNYTTIDIGRDFGTIMLIYEGNKIEITTYRADGKYIDGRRPKNVTFSDDLREDLKRRDLTINALAYNEKDGIKDYFNGIADIENKVIRTVGNPKERFDEDYLRIMRTIRFATELNFKIDKSTYNECLRQSTNLTKISNERIRDELFKILLSEKPSYGFDLMKDTGVLRVILPEVEKTIGFKQNNPHHNKDVYEHTIEVIDNTPKKLEIRLAALFHDLGKIETYSEDEDGIGHFYGHDRVSEEITVKILKRFNTPNKIINNVKRLVSRHMINNKEFKRPGLKRLINYLGEEGIFDLMELQKADRYASSDSNKEIFDILYMEEEINDILLEKEVYDKKSLTIDGNDMIELGCEEGPIIGEILDFAYEIVLEDSTLNNREYLLNRIIKEFELEEN